MTSGGGTPTVKTSSPRQTQYAFRNIDLAAREARRLRPFYPEALADHEGQKLHGIFNPDSWNGGAPNNGPVGLNPLVNNNINVNGFDTDMSDAQNNPICLTPQSSLSYNNSSSNTSYSPPKVQDEDSSTNQTTAMPPITNAANTFTSFSTPSSNQMYTAQRSSSGSDHTTGPMNTGNSQAFATNAQALNDVGRGDLWKSMQGWDLGSSPGPLQGMTSGGEWEKMMSSMGQDMGWGMTPGADETS